MKVHLGTATRVLLLVVVLVLAGWTTLCMVFGFPGDTVSENVRHYCAHYPIIAVGVGFVLGHFFWPLRLKPGEEVP